VQSEPCVLFDLDGTLVDTAGEIVDAVNQSVAPLTGGEPLDYELVRSWIGNGTHVLFRSALGHCGIDAALLEAEFAARWDTFERAYAGTCGTTSTLYPGARDCLNLLHQAGYRMGVVTNKESEFTEKLLQLHGIRGLFDVVISGDTLAQRKPDPQPLWAAFERLGADRRTGLFIGDSLVDLRTGAAAKVRTWALTHGYHHGEFDRPLPAELQPERFVDDFHEIRNLLA